MALDITGLSVDTYEEIINNIATNQKVLISTALDNDVDTSLGQLNAIIAAQISLVNEALQDCYDQRDITKAEGKALDDAVSWLGITRQPASASFGTNYFTGDVDSIIISGTTVRSDSTGYSYTLDSTILLQAAACKFCSIGFVDPLSVSNLVDYTVTVNSTVYNSGTGHNTINEVYVALAAAITADVEATWTATDNGDKLEITTSDGDDLTVTFDEHQKAVKITAAGSMTGTETGSIVQASNTVTTVVTPTAGLDSTYNPNAYTTGRALETDAQLRARAILSTSASGKATVDAIVGSILSIDGVSACDVTEQYVSAGDNGTTGQPAGSILIVVTGGDDNTIWQTIWDYKPAGVETWDAGVPANTNPAGIVVDTNGNNQFVSFSRPTSIPIYVVVEYEVYDTLVYPATDQEAYDAIIEAVNAFGNSLTTGESVESDQFVGVVYCSVEGIKDVVVKMSDVDFPSAVPDTTIVIGATEKALFTTGTTQVTNVT